LRNLQWLNAVNDIFRLPGTDSLWAVGGFTYGPDGYPNPGGNPIVCRSSDGGYNWDIEQPVFASDSVPSPGVQLISVQFVDAHVGFAAGGAVERPSGGATTAVVYRTSDGGITWTLVYEGRLGPSYPRHVIVDLEFTDALNGWAVGAIDPYDNVAIIHTGDGGTTWEAQSTGVNAAVSQVDFLDATEGWAIANLGYTLQTIDGGDQWTTASVNGLFNDGAFGLELLGNGVAVALNPGTLVLRTVDGGRCRPRGTSRRCASSTTCAGGVRRTGKSTARSTAARRGKYSTRRRSTALRPSISSTP
jgi:photosystem II stability/assembly factor-like uncharacterized protein